LGVGDWGLGLGLGAWGLGFRVWVEGLGVGVEGGESVWWVKAAAEQKNTKSHIQNPDMAFPFSVVVGLLVGHRSRAPCQARQMLSRVPSWRRLFVLGAVLWACIAKSSKLTFNRRALCGWKHQPSFFFITLTPRFE